MAVAGELTVPCGQISSKIPTFNAKSQIFGVPMISCSGGKLKSRMSTGVRAVLQMGVGAAESGSMVGGALGFDVVSQEELREKGFLGMRKTKLVCTIGPACSSLEDLERLALGGMNVARLNMCHNSREWHLDVIRKIKKLNEEKGFCVSVVIDTEGSQIHVVDHGAPSSVKVEVSVRQRDNLMLHIV